MPGDMSGDGADEHHKNTTDMDQNPRNHHRFELYQGIANLAPNGPQDGGLCVLRGSHLLHEEHFSATGGFRLEQDSGERENGYNFTHANADWFRAAGCDEVKVCAGEGDLILWDSRLVHWNASPVGAQVRFATYVCYCPRALMGEAGLARKLEVFRERKSTTHFPVSSCRCSREKGEGAVEGHCLCVNEPFEADPGFTSNKMWSLSIATTAIRSPAGRTAPRTRPTGRARLKSRRRHRQF